MARPTEFSQDIADKICEQLSLGKSLIKICKKAGFPNKSTVYRWLSVNREFCDQYARARDLQADHLVEEIIDIADKARIGTKTITKTGEHPSTETITADVVERSKLQIEARKWYAGKLAPKKYGDKVQLTGANGGPIQTQRVPADLSALSDDELEQLAKLVAKSGRDQEGTGETPENSV